MGEGQLALHRELAAPREPMTRELAAPREPLRVVFLSRGRAGSSGLRVHMLVAAMEQWHAKLESQLRFSFSVSIASVGTGYAPNQSRIDSLLSGREARGTIPDVVVLLKSQPRSSLFRTLAQRCILLAVDVVDFGPISDYVISSHGLLIPPMERGGLERAATEPLGPGPAERAHAPAAVSAADSPAEALRPLVIVQTRATVSHIRRSYVRAQNRTALLAVVPHQHTNVGAWRVRQPEAAARPLRRIALLAGDTRNVPSVDVLEQLAEAACSANVTLVVVNQHTRAGSATRLHTYICDETGRAVLPPVGSRKLPSLPGPALRKAAKLKSHYRAYQEYRDGPTYNFSSQRVFHDEPWLGEIDAGLIWAAPRNLRGNELEARPSTRLLFWWSHGVPAIFYPFQACLEAAADHKYVLPGGRTPVARSTDEFATLLRALAADADARCALAKAGLKAATKFSPYGVAATMLQALRQAVTLSRGEGGCSPSRASNIL